MACDPKASRIHGTDTHPQTESSNTSNSSVCPLLAFTGELKYVTNILAFIGKLLSEIQLFSTFSVTPSHLNSAELPITRTVKLISAKAILRRTSNPTKS